MLCIYTVRLERLDGSAAWADQKQTPYHCVYGGTRLERHLLCCVLSGLSWHHRFESADFGVAFDRLLFCPHLVSRGQQVDDRPDLAFAGAADLSKHRHDRSGGVSVPSGGQQRVSQSDRGSRLSGLPPPHGQTPDRNQSRRMGCNQILSSCVCCFICMEQCSFHCTPFFRREQRSPAFADQLLPDYNSSRKAGLSFQSSGRQLRGA